MMFKHGENWIALVAHYRAELKRYFPELNEADIGVDYKDSAIILRAWEVNEADDNVKEVNVWKQTNALDDLDYMIFVDLQGKPLTMPGRD